MKLHKPRLIIVTAAILAVGLAMLGVWGVWAGAQETASVVMVWPVSGTTSPDLPQSSPYGPRQKASEDFRYDYHQGIDIPIPVGTTLVAVMTGTVRIAGQHPAYSDGVVQLAHEGGLYSDYLHITRSLVTTGQQVIPGQPVALSGVNVSGFSHLHFEIRKSVWRKDAVNPWGYLPYSDTVRHTAVITDIRADGVVWVRVSTPPDELDLAAVALTVTQMSDGTVMDTRIIDYEARNLAYNGAPATLDNPDLDNILLVPHPFSSQSSAYVVDIKFHSLRGLGAIRVDACAIDVRGNRVCDAKGGEFGRKVYLPLIVR